jgi:hypothetical protein
MGFLKNVGKTLKKEISFKNLVKVANQASAFIPVAGGVIQGQIQALQDANAAKKELRRAVASGDAAQIATSQLNADLSSQNAAKYAGSISKSMSNTIVSTTLAEAQKGISEGATSQAGKLGSKLVNATIKEWFLSNWKWILVVGSATAIYYKYFCCGSKKRTRSNYRRF